MDQVSSPFFQPQALLEERLGKDCFQALPKTPGIYRFYNHAGSLLYVGKAKNLRSRLFTYKRARAGSVSRKVSKLIGRISSFEIVETETEQDALLLENQMIRTERPPFNHANKQTEAYYFVYLKPDEAGIEFRLSMRIHEETDESYWHGCFKGHTPVRRSFGCLLRLLWMAEQGDSSPHYLPVQLTRNLTPMRFLMKWRDKNSPSLRNDAAEMLLNWTRGENCSILDWLVVQIECGNDLTRFETLHLEHHLECLKSFYDRKLVRHKTIRGERRHIGQNELDDLLVRVKA